LVDNATLTETLDAAAKQAAIVKEASGKLSKLRALATHLIGAGMASPEQEKRAKTLFPARGRKAKAK
jgi:hypothetical protein